jgi:hypothetical protein
MKKGIGSRTKHNQKSKSLIKEEKPLKMRRVRELGGLKQNSQSSVSLDDRKILNRIETTEYSHEVDTEHMYNEGL